ncbi:MAG: hypothetical protein HY242_16910 [Afipia sp.]|nr:hypothetical protein [Afipia sp.]
MPAIAEFQSDLPLRAQPLSRKPICKICSDQMISAEASVLSETEVSYLWSCDTCGYGFVTVHKIKPVCN